MGGVFRWTVGACATLVITALFQPFLDNILRNAGWFDAPGNAVGAALNWLEQIVGVAAFPWVAAGTLGVAAGVWGDTFLRRLDGRHPVGRAAKAKAIAASLTDLALDIEASIRLPYPMTSRYPTLFSEVEILTTKLRALGIPPPTTVRGGDARDNLARAASYLKIIAPFLREGDLSKATKLVEHLNDKSASEDA